MLAYLVFALTIGLALYLWREANADVTVPLSVWMIPVALLAAAGAIFLGVGIDNPARAARAATDDQGSVVFARTLSDLFATGRFFFLGTAALAALETALAGHSGQLQRDPDSLFESLPFWSGWGLAIALAVALYWQADPTLLDKLPVTRIVLALPPLIVAGTGVGIAHTLQRKTPSSFPFAIGGVGMAGLATFYLGGRLTRWEADALAYASDSNALLVGASSPNLPYDTVILVATAAGAFCVLALSILGAVLEEKPWKWGTLGDGILFLLVTIVFSSSLGWSWGATSNQYRLLEKLTDGTSDAVVSQPSPNHQSRETDHYRYTSSATAFRESRVVTNRHWVPAPRPFPLRL